MKGNGDKRNATRQTIPRDPRNPQDHLNSGYEEQPSLDFYIPSCGIRDADEALFRLFDEDIGFVVDRRSARDKTLDPKKPFVVFAAGERFAVAKKLKPPRNTQGSLILPAISIRKTGITQESADMTSRGMNQHTGNIIVRRRLSSDDRNYQNLINKLALKNRGLTEKSLRTQGEFGPDEYKGTKEGGFLESHNKDNIWEILSIPQPQFYTISYDVTFWTDKVRHLNDLVEKFMVSYLPQGKSFKLMTPKGYWFIATVNEGSHSDNFDDYTEEERILRYTFSIDVRAYLLVPEGDTDEIPIRRWLSSPNISFDIEKLNNEVISKETLDNLEAKRESAKGIFSLTDINGTPETSKSTGEKTPTTNERLRVRKVYMDESGNRKDKYVQILEPNEKSGETIYRASDFESFERFLKD